jgi:hypothetical protein
VSNEFSNDFDVDNTFTFFFVFLILSMHAFGCNTSSLFFWRNLRSGAKVDYIRLIFVLYLVSTLLELFLTL